MKLLCFMLFLVISATSAAIDVVEFDDAIERERYQSLIYELRCPKCQNQNLSDSNSQISQDLRREVARLIHDGKTDDEIKRQLVALYGDFILYKPPVQNNTLVLWLGPILMMGIGVLVFLLILVKRIRAGDNAGDDAGGIESTESLDENLSAAAVEPEKKSTDPVGSNE